MLGHGHQDVEVGLAGGAPEHVVDFGLDGDDGCSARHSGEIEPVVGGSV